MIIFISGSINSGKSTIAKLLSQKISNTALVEIDSLSNFIDWMPIDQKIALNLENACLIINNFIAHGFNIVVPYPLSKNNYNYLLSEINTDGQVIHTFILNPDLDLVLSNRGQRKLNNQEIERIKIHYQKKINNPGFGQVIDNTHQSPEETVKIIYKSLK
jgi:hypothetical protein